MSESNIDQHRMMQGIDDTDSHVKTKPREITLVETDENNDRSLAGNYMTQYFRNEVIINNAPKIWRVKE